MKTTILLSTLLLFSCGSAQEEKKSDSSNSENETSVAEETIREETVETIQATYKTISTDEFEKQIESPCTVLDVRTQGEVLMGIIPNATVMNINDAKFIDEIKTLDKSKPVCVYCKAGGRSAKASEMLVELGYTVYNLDGGMDAWLAAGKTVVKK